MAINRTNAKSFGVLLSTASFVILPSWAQAQPVTTAETQVPALSTPVQPESRIVIGPQGVTGSPIHNPVRSRVGSTIVAYFSEGRASTSPEVGALPNRVPVSGRLTSRFGARMHPISGRWRQHAGIDLAAPAGSPVVATSDGLVVSAGWVGGYGLQVALSHAGAIETRYAHLSRLAVSAGQRVVRGEVIGFVGSTGNSTGPHVHYEVRSNGRAIDPLAQ